MSDKASAETLQNEWLARSRPGWTVKDAQKMVPIRSTINALIETIKYGSKVISQPEKPRKNSVKKAGKIYIKALHRIFIAMKGLRIFERFGFNLQPQEQCRIGSRLVSDCTQWKFDNRRFDWFNSAGERLTNYCPETGLIDLLSGHMDSTCD